MLTGVGLAEVERLTEAADAELVVVQLVTAGRVTRRGQSREAVRRHQSARR